MSIEDLKAGSLIELMIAILLAIVFIIYSVVSS